MPWGTAVPARADSRLLLTWVAWVSAGEALGFLAPALAQVVTTQLNPSAITPALVAAGAVEGAVLGWSQARVLKRRLPTLSAARWIAGTAVAAAIAWFIGLLLSSDPEAWPAWPLGGQIVVGALAAAVLLGSIGFAQWLELRRHVARSGWWVAGTAAAWCVGLSVFLAVATPLWQPGQALWLTLLIGVAAGALMAVSMAVVTGLVLVRMLRAASRRAPSAPPARYGAV